MEKKVSPRSTVAQVHACLCQRNSSLRGSTLRLLFGGRHLNQLDSDLKSYGVQKESTLTCFVVPFSRIPVTSVGGNDGIDPSEEDSPSPPPVAPPRLVSQKTHPNLRHGDVLIVELVEARGGGGQNQASPPDSFVTLSVGRYSVRSSVCRENRNPVWGETFGFHLAEAEDQAEILSLFLFQLQQQAVQTEASGTAALQEGVKHPSPGHHLGGVEIDLRTLPRDGTWDRFFPLQADPADPAASGGEVRLRLRRAALSSPELAEITKTLSGMQQSWTSELLRTHR